MAAKRKTTKRPAPRSGRSSGGRVSASGSVHIHLFSGLLSNLFSNFSLIRAGGGGGGRGRGKGGLLKRLATSAAKTFGELNGKDVTRGKITGREKGRTFDEFAAERPDLFEPEVDVQVDVDQGYAGPEVDVEEATANWRARTGGSPGGACPCGGIDRHAQDCEVWR